MRERRCLANRVAAHENLPESQALGAGNVRGMHNNQHRFRVRRDVLQLSIRRQRVHRHDHCADARHGDP